jgi:DNA polymerase I-like protein with 3'-5' exonuclease and polymerase domains
MLESTANPKIFHGLKKTVQLLSKIGIELQGIGSDVKLAAHMTDPLGRRYELDYLMGRKLNMSRKHIGSNIISPVESQLSMFEEAEKVGYIQHCENA